MFAPLCEAWPLPPSGCADVTASPPVTGVAAMAASEFLWAVSGYQFGQCEVTLRPCRQNCVPVGSSWSTSTWWSGGWPVLIPGSTLWMDAVCGRCSGGCDCGTADTLHLADTVQNVVAVTIDGATLPPSGYALYSGDLLVRTDGATWPLCQNWAAAANEVGAWTVAVTVGKPIPALGILAMGEVYNRFVGFCSSGTCKHPAYLTQRSRQGDTQTFPSVKDLREAGLTGCPITDDFILAFNPDGGRRDAAIWNPDEVAALPRTGGH